MFSIGTGEFLIILIIILIIFGPKKLPELARGLGKGLREFRKASSEIQEELNLDTPVEDEQTNKQKAK